MRKILVFGGAAVLVAGVVFLTVAISKVSSLTSAAAQAAVNDACGLYSDALGLGCTSSGDSNGVYSQLDSWTQLRAVAWVVVATGGVLLGAGLLVGWTESQRRAVSGLAPADGPGQVTPSGPVIEASGNGSSPYSDMARGTVAQRLAELEALHADGVLTAEEHARRRAEVIGEI